jgi:hypothetical protein
MRKIIDIWKKGSLFTKLIIILMGIVSVSVGLVMIEINVSLIISAESLASKIFLLLFGNLLIFGMYMLMYEIFKEVLKEISC